jgi:hypothetical protein
VTGLTCGEWVAHCRRWNVNVAGDVLAPPEVVPFDPSVVPEWLPLTDPLNTYGGAGPLPHWKDVYNWVAGSIATKLSPGTPTSNVTWGDQENIWKATAGQTIAALSYFLIQDEQSNIAINNAQTIALDQLQLNTIGTFIQAGLILAQIPAQILQGQAAVIAQAQALMLQGVARAQAYTDAVGAVDRQYAIDTIFKPLTDVIGQVDANAKVREVQVAAMIPPEAQAIATATVAPVAAEVAVLAPALAAVEAALKPLTDQAANCVNDMCKTMGPNTDLGKFLKALNLAGEAALLAELAALDGNGVKSVLQGLISLSKGVVNDVEALFTGGENVGQLFAKEGSAII